MSLAQEQGERAAAAAAATEQQIRKRGRFHREVSMTRVFKNKGKGRGKNLGGAGVEDKRSAGGTVKIEPPKFEKTRKDQGVTLVDETPVKPRISSTLENTTRNVSIKPLNFAIAEAKRDNILMQPMLTEKGDQEEEWMMDRSAAVVVFDPVLEARRPNYDSDREEESSRVQVMRTRKSSRGKSRKK